MPAYNTEKYVSVAINSILNQTFTDFELIIVNDGSTDDTENIIKLFTDSRIRYYKQENQGVAKALNYGLSKCTGRYIRRHDADDVSTTNALEKQVRFIENNPQYPLISSQIAFMTENGKIAYKFRNPGSGFFQNNSYIEVTKDNYWQKRPIIHATVMAKRSLFEEVGGYREEFPTAEDIDLWFRILEKNNAAVINECNYYVRLHGSSNTAIHGKRNAFYRNLAYELFKERSEKSSDKIIRGEQVFFTEEIDLNSKKSRNKELAKKYKLFRNDILDYYYRIFVDAKDWRLVGKAIIFALKDGWKLKQTWKALLFPILGKKIVKLGVKIKKLFK